MNTDMFMGKLRGKQVKGEIYFGYVKFNMHIKYLKGEGVRRKTMEFEKMSGLEI